MAKFSHPASEYGKAAGAHVRQTGGTAAQAAAAAARVTAQVKANGGK